MRQSNWCPWCAALAVLVPSCTYDLSFSDRPSHATVQQARIATHVVPEGHTILTIGAVHPRVGGAEDGHHRGAHSYRQVYGSCVVANKEVAPLHESTQLPKGQLPRQIPRLLPHALFDRGSDGSVIWPAHQEHLSPPLLNEAVGQGSEALGWPTLGR